MKKENQFAKTISAITLEGFQVFDKPTRIPFGKLTFLFGPNSAGKSAVQDALSIFQMVMDSDAPYAKSENLQQELRRHWRRSGTARSDLVERMSIAIQHSFIPGFDDTSEQFRRHRFDESYPQHASWFSTPQIFESKIIFIKSDLSANGEIKYELNYELHSGGDLLISKIGSGIRVNLDHPYFIFSDISDEFLHLSRAFKNQIFFENEYLVIPNGIKGFRFGVSDIDDRRSDGFYPDRNIFKRERDKHNEEISEFLKKALKELGRTVGLIIHITNNERPSWYERVDASRRVPTREDMTFKFERVNGHLTPANDKRYEYGQGYDLNFIWLAFAIKDDLEVRTKTNLGFHRENNHLVSINKALSGHLFLDRGYQLDYSFRVILSEANSLAAVEGRALDSKEFGFEVEIFLKNADSGNHYFEDVGSGIGYVLPVLCALNSVRSDFVTIQQPELHLHPALQTEMGDVFIESMGRGTQAVIETHSEHILLRILRRIRETNEQKTIDEDLAIHAEDLCVAYFNPTLDGVTTVKHLRISRDGKFLDRWPRGFFAERSTELFDE